MPCVDTGDCEGGILYAASYIWVNMIFAYNCTQQEAGTFSELLVPIYQ